MVGFNQAQATPVVLVGFGAIGRRVAQALDQGLPGLQLKAIAVRDTKRPPEGIVHLACRPAVISVADVATYGRLVVDCGTAQSFSAVANATLKPGMTLMTVNSAALLEQPDLVTLAERVGARIIVPSGAIPGLDAIAASACSRLDSVKLVTRKPPLSFRGVSFVETLGLGPLEGLTSAVQLFAGSARLAARHFPQNVNVGATLSLAGIGPERTEVEVWADPGVTRNSHRIEVVGDACRLTMEIENLPAPDNPKTSALTALSVIARLKCMTAPLSIGI